MAQQVHPILTATLFHRSKQLHPHPKLVGFGFERLILLYGHNVKFDAKAILRSCVAGGLCEMFLSTVTGFCDTYSLLKEIVPGLKS